MRLFYFTTTPVEFSTKQNGQLKLYQEFSADDAKVNSLQAQHDLFTILATENLQNKHKHSNKLSSRTWVNV